MFALADLSKKHTKYADEVIEQCISGNTKQPSVGMVLHDKHVVSSGTWMKFDFK